MSPVTAAPIHDRAQRTTEIAGERWGGTTLQERLGVIRRARQKMAVMGKVFSAGISPQLQRSAADTLVTELLPLLDAMQFLEREATAILAPRRLGSHGRAWWLGGITAEVRRAPLGRVLVIGPSNFPLLLPGVQTMQALAAGNGVTWKPGAGGRRVADMVAGVLRDAGLPAGVLRITEESVGAAQQAIAQGVDKVIFTGSAEAGRAVMERLARDTVPSVMELSGADAVLVLPGADLQRVAKAVAFGLRLNGSAVCMSPRRLLALGDTMRDLKPLLLKEFAHLPAVSLPERTGELLSTLVREAMHLGAIVSGDLQPAAQLPLLVDGARPDMRITCTDVFAPVLSLMVSSQIAKMPETLRECRYALTVSIFGPEKQALALSRTVPAGTVLINSLIAPTADARVPFSGVAGSGFGATRGAEGLLEMTGAQTVLVQRGKNTRQFEAADSADHEALFDGMIRSSHAKGAGARWTGVRDAIAAAKQLKKR